MVGQNRQISSPRQSWQINQRQVNFMMAIKPQRWAQTKEKTINNDTARGSCSRENENVRQHEIISL